MTNLREMDKFFEMFGDVCPDCGHELNLNEDFLELHKRIEQRINKLEQPVLGLKGGVNRQEVLKIIEEEFGRLDNIR